MTKTSTVCTKSPDQFTAGYGVFEDDAQAVAEMLNWSVGERPVVHASMGCGPVNFAGGTEPMLGNAKFNTASGWNRRFIFKIVVAPEVKAIIVGARCFMSGTGLAQQGQVRFTVGAAPATTLTTFTDLTNGSEHKASIATSSSGTGELIVVIEINHTVGSANDCFLRNYRTENDRIAATDLPDPPDA